MIIAKQEKVYACAASTGSRLAEEAEGSSQLCQHSMEQAALMESGNSLQVQGIFLKS